MATESIVDLQRRSSAAARRVSRVRLRPLRMADAPRVRRWMADLAVIRFTVVVPGPEYGPVEPYAPAEADRYLEVLVRDPSRLSFAIELDGAHVGNVGLKEYDPRRPTAECFIELGEARGRGVGHAAMRLLLDDAFGRLRLERVRLGVFEFNAPARRLYRKLGFVDDGAYGSHWAERRFWRVLAMRLDRAAWTARRAPA
jgi:RimJ/RimL family protein N-acetyltransferase